MRSAHGSVPTCPSSCTTCASTATSWIMICWLSLMGNFAPPSAPHPAVICLITPTQVMSPSSAAMSVERAHADQPFRPETSVSRWRALRSPLLRTLNSTFRSIKQQPAYSSKQSYTLLKLGLLGTRLTKVLADNDSVASRTGIKETCADMHREKVVLSLLGSMSKGKRDRHQNVVQTLTDRQNIHKIPERKADLAVRGEKLAQQRFCEAEADVEVKHWEKRKSDIVFMRSIRSSNLNDFSYNKRINGLIRLKEIKSACMENWKRGTDCTEKIKQKIAKTLKN